MATLTPILGLSKPIVGADDDVWGGMWNANADILDTLVRPVDLNAYLKLAGGTMQGPMALAGNAVTAMQPVPLQQLTSVAGNYVAKAGDTMTGPLVLNGNAAAALNPVPLQQLTTSLAPYLLKSGGAMTGVLTLAADATTGLQATTYQQLTAGLGTKIGDAPADSAYYARRNNAWAVAPGSAITTDAPSDSFAYGRLNAAWSKVLPLTGGLVTGQTTVASSTFTTKGNLMVGGVTEPANMATMLAGSGGVVRAWYMMAQNYMSFCYYDNAGTVYRRLDATNLPGQMQINQGRYEFLGAAAGAIDSTFTWNTLFTINTFGSIGVGNITLPGDAGGSLVSAANLVVSNAMATNIYFSNNGNVWRYRNNGSAGMIHMDTSVVPQMNFFTAPVGTAGAQATISNVFSVRADGVVAFPWFSTSTSATIGASLYVNGTLFINPQNSWEWQQYVEGGSADHITIHRGGYYQRWANNGGQWTWVNGNTTAMTLAGSDLVVYNNFQANGIIQCGGFYSWGSARTDGNMFGFGGMWCGGNQAYDFGFFRNTGNASNDFRFSTDWRWMWATSGGQLSWVVGGNFMFNQRSSDWLAWNATGTIGGNGAYYNISDRRVKDEIEPATVGLPEILRMQAKQYIRLRPTDRPPRPGGGEWPVLAPLREVGFLAQDLRDVLPLAVHEIGDEMPTAHLARDDEGPLLAISYDTITTALVNAVKTLNGRLVKLEGRH